MHLLSQVRFVLPCVAFYRCNLEEEEEGEFELELGGVAVLRTFGRRTQNGLLSLPSWSPFWIRPSKNRSIQLPPFLPEREPQVLLGVGFLAQPADALILAMTRHTLGQFVPMGASSSEQV